MKHRGGRRGGRLARQSVAVPHGLPSCTGTLFMELPPWCPWAKGIIIQCPWAKINGRGCRHGPAQTTARQFRHRSCGCGLRARGFGRADFFRARHPRNSREMPARWTSLRCSRAAGGGWLCMGVRFRCALDSRHPPFGPWHCPGLRHGASGRSRSGPGHPETSERDRVARA